MIGHTAVGIDVGGTFTDIVVRDSNGLTVLKIPTSNDPVTAVEIDVANGLLTSQKAEVDYWPKAGSS